jgi:hypothetical protein
MEEIKFTIAQCAEYGVGIEVTWQAGPTRWFRPKEFWLNAEVKIPGTSEEVFNLQSRPLGLSFLFYQAETGEFEVCPGLVATTWSTVGSPRLYLEDGSTYVLRRSDVLISRFGLRHKTGPSKDATYTLQLPLIDDVDLHLGQMLERVQELKKFLTGIEARLDAIHENRN